MEGSWPILIAWLKDFYRFKRNNTPCFVSAILSYQIRLPEFPLPILEEELFVWHPHKVTWL